jgi:hypothetical protein
MPSSDIPSRRHTAAERLLSREVTAHASGRPPANPRSSTALAAAGETVAPAIGVKLPTDLDLTLAVRKRFEDD